MEAIFDTSREAVVRAIMGVGRVDAMRAMWGDGFDPLLDYLGLALPPQEVGLDILRESVGRRPVCKTMVLSGERCSGKDIQRGTDSPILLGLVEVMEILRPVSSLQSRERTGREPNALSLIFSGGVTLTPEMGELPGNVMADQFDTMTCDGYTDVVGADSYSLNTGDQGRTLAGIVFSRRIERLVFAHVRDHCARFGATVTMALQQLVDVENRLLDGILREHEGEEHEALRARITAARRFMPEILFVAIGDWDDRDPRRGRDDGLGISRAREAFGPMQTVDEEMFRGKRLGCEYADRYSTEQNPVKSIGYACPALAPRDMIALIPPWVKDYMGYSATT